MIVHIWHLNCHCQDVEQTRVSPPKVVGLLGLLALLFPMNTLAETPLMRVSAPSADLAFARYIASAQEGNLFWNSGPVAVEIQASLPGLYKETRFLAIREMGESEHSAYRVLQIEGDAIVAQEVIARYLEMQGQLEELSSSSVAITPANYKFHYEGKLGTGSALTYVYQITPRKKRAGLIQGQVWIDSVTGAALLQAGRFVKAPFPFSGKIDFVRDTQFLGAIPVLRVTHMTIKIAPAGRAELTITEIPLTETQEDRQLKPVPLGEGPGRSLGPEEMQISSDRARSCQLAACCQWPPRDC